MFKISFPYPTNWNAFQPELGTFSFILQQTVFLWLQRLQRISASKSLKGQRNKIFTFFWKANPPGSLITISMNFCVTCFWFRERYLNNQTYLNWSYHLINKFSYRSRTQPQLIHSTNLTQRFHITIKYAVSTISRNQTPPCQRRTHKFAIFDNISAKLKPYFMVILLHTKMYQVGTMYEKNKVKNYPKIMTVKL